MTGHNARQAGLTHELKADPIPFEDVISGRKTAEVRFDDRGFHVGDELFLRETSADRKSYTGREFRCTISHIQRGYGLPDGVVVLSLAAQSADASDAATGQGLRRDQEAAYDSIDRFLRNNLCDEDYAHYSSELDSLLAAPAAPAPKLTPHTQDVEQMLDCDEAAPVPAAQA